MKRHVYLAMKTLDEARDLFFSSIGPQPQSAVEVIGAADALGRVTAEPVFARRSSPGFHSAAMDGIAVSAEETFGTTERAPKILKLPESAAWVNTGQPLPAGFDAVIMVEKIHQLDEQRMEIRAPAYPWQHVRKVGEDIVATELLLPGNHRIRPYDIGALVSGGVFTLAVWRKPKVAIIPSGSELVDHARIQESDPLPGNRIIESNSLVLAALVRECGAEPQLHPIVPDDEDRIREAIRQAVDSDAQVVLLNAGSSAGSKDFTANVLGELGRVLVHGVAMMPGKPTILALVKGKPVVGNPGYAVSSVLSFEQFVRPLLYRLQGCRPPDRPAVQVTPTRDIPSKMGLEEFIRVSIGRVGERYVATPLPRAAGSITTLTRAEGILQIPAFSEGIAQNEPVAAHLLVSPEELLRTVVIIGSHDIALDILGDEVRRAGRDIRISSGNVGSLGGLIALRKGTCHMAGAHLLDTATGQYNLSYVRRYLAGMPVRVFHLVLREQGLIVAPGNPKGIRGLPDLTRRDVTLVNRQPGSGTRILLDHLLRRENLRSAEIRGYDHVEYTHMAVAVDVLSGAADCGVGIFAAARALGLDFIALEREQYDLIVPRARLEEPNLRAVLETIRSEHFRQRVVSLGGYDAARSGERWTDVEETSGDRA